MVLLSRTVRFCISPAMLRSGAAPHEADRYNTFAAWPSMDGLGWYFELEVCCRGEVDPRTGYFLNIKTIDEAVRQTAIPTLHRALKASSEQNMPRPESILPDLGGALDGRLFGCVAIIRLKLTPFLLFELESNAMNRCVVRQQFEFAASHRLHCNDLTADENRRIFGKCNHKNGHGHNYRLEVGIAIQAGPNAPPFRIAEVEKLVSAAVIDRFDHKNLNADCAEFAQLNPTVENIAVVCHSILQPILASAGHEIRDVTVWETEKTRCTYPA